MPTPDPGQLLSLPGQLGGADTVYRFKLNQDHIDGIILDNTSTSHLGNAKLELLLIGVCTILLWIDGKGRCE